MTRPKPLEASWREQAHTGPWGTRTRDSDGRDQGTRRPAPRQLSLWTQPDVGDELAIRLATASGLVRPGAALWDDARTPIHPLSMESAYADPQLLGDLGARGARFARDLGADVVVGAETAGVPLAASIALAAGLPFAFVRKPG